MVTCYFTFLSLLSSSFPSLPLLFPSFPFFPTSFIFTSLRFPSFPSTQAKSVRDLEATRREAGVARDQHVNAIRTQMEEERRERESEAEVNRL